MFDRLPDMEKMFYFALIGLLLCWAFFIIGAVTVALWLFIIPA